MKIQSLLMAATASLAITGAANAATISGTFAAALIGVSSNPPQIGEGAQLSNVFGIVSSSTGEFGPISAGTLLSFATVTASNGSPVSFTSDFGNFSGLLSNLSTVGPPNAVVSFNSLGEFSPLGTLSGFTKGPAKLTVSFTQTFEDNGSFSDSAPSISGSFTLSSAPIPEPASWAMLIAGFGLVGVAARRRQATVVAA